MIDIFGYYTVHNKIFYDKTQALRHGTELGLNYKEITYHYYDEIFSSVNINSLGKISLDEIYKQRALQLRDSYDYLVLYYSGGCDSWNIRHTFLKNNIKLDCVFTRWPLQANKFHNFNTIDKSAYNFMSEWKYVIEGDLQYIREHHPDIHIEVKDWIGMCQENYFNDKLFETQPHWHSAANFMRMRCWSDYEIDKLSKGKKVAEIYGTDKPIIAIKDNIIGLSFQDNMITNSQPYPYNIDGLELFYWTPKMPNITFEQAYRMMELLNYQTTYKNYIRSKDFIPNLEHHMYITNNFTKKCIYPDWDTNRFQADKPMSGFRRDKDYWLYAHGEFDQAIKKWNSIYNDELQDIHENFCVVKNDVKEGFKSYRTKYYYVGKLDKS